MNRPTYQQASRSRHASALERLQDAGTWPGSRPTILSTSSPATTRRDAERRRAACSTLLEDTRERLDGRFARAPARSTVVVHGTRRPARARPAVAAARAAADRPGRAPLPRRLGRRARAPRAGAAAARAPRLDVAGLARDAAARAGRALRAARGRRRANPRLPPPFTPAATSSATLRWAWLVEGAAQWLSRPDAHARAGDRPAAARGPRADVPARACATPRCSAARVLDLLAREEGDRTAVAPPGRSAAPRRARAAALREPSPAARSPHTEGAWRAHLERG